MIIIGAFTIFNFLFFFFRPEYKGYTPLFVLLAAILLYGALKRLYLWYHYFSISIPKPLRRSKDLKVDILTTYFPGEPYEMILETLRAIQKIEYPHTTYLCDEGNDPLLIKECKKLGVIHVTRNNRIDAKAGNINNALNKATGEICLILDPDHVPKPNFLDVVLPYFNDEKMGYVQVVQAYYNKPHTLVARGAAEQTFQFYGPMMMTMNSYGTVNAIGANCTFRRAALDSIGGHAPGLAEDMHTAMLLHAKGWKSVYVPELVAKGLAPSDLTSYYKQQLKWSRGTFELLYSVYPKIFKKLTFRQKIHYGLLPLHYLIGFVYLFSFLIPIGSLLLSRMPWTGNIIHFFTLSIPIFMSSLLIRTFIQKWVIEKNERGFHIIGGLLQIITWWIFILGVIYTFIRKKVPYLPTPKKEEKETNFYLLVPNMIIGVLSIFAIIYGLYQDLTPFSIFMSFFALMNAMFMFFSIYLATKVTNRNKILRSTLERRTIQKLKEVKQNIIVVFDHIFVGIRRLALPILLTVVYLSFVSVKKIEDSKWDEVGFYPFKEKADAKYLGIFYPSGDNGMSDIGNINQLEQREEIKFRIISSYIAWGESDPSHLPLNFLKQIKGKNAVPMITWEPWANEFALTDTIQELKKGHKVLKYIKQGYFDSYIKEFALAIKNFGNPILLRFAHEFDNPAYPWSQSGGNTSEDFKQAWLHVYGIFEALEVDNVSWVYNPWKDDALIEYYPGDAYVDWIGITLLNYGSLNKDGVFYDFDRLYEPYHESVKLMGSKQVLLTEFGSLNVGGNQEEWLRQAFTAMDAKYHEIKGVVFFNSKWDKNIPESKWVHDMKYLDWTVPSFGFNDSSFFKDNGFGSIPDTLPKTKFSKHKYSPIPISKDFRGIGYNKARNWKDNYYVASKRVLENDFQLMKAAGINIIRYEPSRVYDYNVLKYASEWNLNVLYSIRIPPLIDFLKEGDRLEELSRDIINTIEQLKKSENIVGWNIVNDTWSNLSNEYRFVELKTQRKAYLNWLTDVVDKIKQIDPDRVIVKDIQLSRGTNIQIKEIKERNIKLDAFGLLLDDENYLTEFLSFADKENIPYLVSRIDPNDLSDLKDLFEDRSIFITNWQNRRETNKVTFDGLLDFEGRKKKEYAVVRDLWNQTKMDISLPEFRILRPAIPLLPDWVVSYYVVYHNSHTWLYPDENNDYIFEWHLAKNDVFGNTLAIKKLGTGPSVALAVPEHYHNYDIVLTVVKGEMSTSIQTTLNTPLHSPLISKN
jgi:cellulose synthase/poly-beta-1,6-N-acetylglucosamine synthase-like glycosyltransferase/beta-mannanase